jgi:hypothetical protein
MELKFAWNVCRLVVQDGSLGDKAAVDAFQLGLDMKKLEDRNGNPVILFLNEWAVNYVERKNPELKFLRTAPLKRAKEDECEKPCSEACERNKGPILAVFKQHIYSAHAS